MIKTIADFVLGFITITISGGILCMNIYGWLCSSHRSKKKAGKGDNFEKLMRRQLELDTERFRAYEDMLREACWSQEKECGDDYEGY